MTNKLLILCLLLIASTSIFSQNTLTITSEQLRLTNAIFIEHEKFSKQIPLLKQQISNLEQINNSWQQTDSIRKQQLVYCNQIIEDKNKSIENLNKSLKRNKNLLKGSCVVGALAVIVCLLVN
jgi:hypothetical protein